jgi:hypothetical protein
VPFTLADAVFDYGGHAYFTKYAHVTELIDATTAATLYVVPYPFQSNH